MRDASLRWRAAAHFEILRCAQDDGGFLNQTSKEVFALLGERTHGMELDESLPLGSGGLGLDSIALVEVLLECEERFGVTIAPELLEQSPLTVGALVARIDALLSS